MSIGSTELKLYADNDPEIYHRHIMPIAKNLATKKARGTYDRGKAHKEFKLDLAKPAAQKYVREFGSRDAKWNVVFTIVDRDDFAKEYVSWFEESYREGDFEPLLPAKYQKKATKKATGVAFKHAGSQSRGKSAAKRLVAGQQPTTYTIEARLGHENVSTHETIGDAYGAHLRKSAARKVLAELRESAADYGMGAVEYYLVDDRGVEVTSS